ncbi:aldehyde dehydrogenase family 3 member A2 isoform X2 [Strongylocentrotus purpuratus]|uniref:Aldehyde dehydrogenase n=1 Tax=Strongylocentrotus purpuratus TaxID=7668 RepID=A0A7M7PBP0_STRPU|nr:aldehyde dehydrogenase family 3 member A2 isoform X2 [Strongylocentrotus purpuratus]
MLNTFIRIIPQPLKHLSWISNSFPQKNSPIIRRLTRPVTMATFDAKAVVERGRAAFRAGKTRSYEARMKHLKDCYRMIQEHRQDFIDAIHKDLKKPAFESNAYEIMMAEKDIVQFMNELEDWIKPMNVPTDIMTVGKVAYNVWEPLGLSLIIGAWNYPFQLVIEPLVAAMVAGNTAIIKPSELAMETALLYEKLFPQYLDNDCYQVVNGEVKVTTQLLEQKFDHILYTGSGVVGRIVMGAAAKHLTPVTLELGGKSPCYIDSDCDIVTSVRRVTWGRFMNCGQTCVAPDYVICHSRDNERIVKAFRSAVKELYGEDPQQNPAYARIVNQRHFKRIAALMDGQNVVIGGQTDESDLYIAPTVILNASETAKCMTEEIFGPILPIFNLDTVDQAIDFINDRDKPLALYAFSNNLKTVQRFADETSSGAFLGNDVIIHAAIDSMPFGGVGGSGQGSYHGKFSFEVFSHKKPVLIDKHMWLTEKAQGMRYPPYTPRKTQITQFFLKKSPKRKGFFYTFLKLTLIGFLLAVVCKAFGVEKYLPSALKQ